MLNLTTEKVIFNSGYNSLAALDEAGRGPLAGPVVAACVFVNPKFKIENELLKKVNDSKKLSEKRREELFDVICSEFSDYGIGICDHKTIDRINILQASFLAMKKAVGSLKNKPNFLILDGKFPIPNTSFQQEPIIKGDSRVFSIAAASILAKVTRDRIMLEMNEKYPDYGFDKHKGYGTKMHIEQIRKYGPCAIHRRTFAPIKNFI